MVEWFSDIIHVVLQEVVTFFPLISPENHFWSDRQP